MSSEQVSQASENITIAGLAGRYAVALFDLAREANKIDDVAKDIASLKALLAESSELSDITNSPVLSRADQAKALSAVAGHAGLGDMVQNFIGVLANNRRLDQTNQIINEFDRLVAHHKGEIKASVTSAHALDNDQLDALKAKLKSMVGRDVNVETNVDASLLGGMVVNIGSQMIDSSLKTKLANLEESMKEVG